MRSVPSIWATADGSSCTHVIEHVDAPILLLDLIGKFALTPVIFFDDLAFGKFNDLLYFACCTFDVDFEVWVQYDSNLIITHVAVILSLAWPT